MENASKALLIAGAVLIVILIIGVGMAIFSGAQGNIDSAMSSMSSDQIQQFNSKFEAYEGTKRGSQVRTLLNAVAANNQNYDDGQDGRITITVNPDGGEDSTSADPDAIRAGRANFAQNNNYEIEIGYGDSGIVDTITIE